jgi:hypothetical protein
VPAFGDGPNDEKNGINSKTLARSMTNRMAVNSKGRVGAGAKRKLMLELEIEIAAHVRESSLEGNTNSFTQFQSFVAEMADGYEESDIPTSRTWVEGFIKLYGLAKTRMFHLEDKVNRSASAANFEWWYVSVSMLLGKILSISISFIPYTHAYIHTYIHTYLNMRVGFVRSFIHILIN